MTDRINVSVVIMTKNEERNIVEALQSARQFAEVFVVDSDSSDATATLARDFGAEVVEFQWNGQYPKKKQWCLEYLPLAFDWVLYLDADERLTPRLVDEIRELFAHGEPTCGGFFIELEYVFLGRKLRHGHRVVKLALLHRRRAHFVDYDDLDATNMWEVEGHYQPIVSGGTRALQNRIEHRDHDDLFHYFERHNKYSDWEAVLAAKQKLVADDETQPPLRRTTKRLFMALPFRGVAFFLYSYLFRFGVLDGRAGFHYSLAKAFYYWQTGLKTREFEARRPR